MSKDENPQSGFLFLGELENEELDQPIQAVDSTGIIIAGHIWNTKCTECLQFIIEGQGEYAECSIRQEPHNCEGPFIFKGV
jgi:hypothetical protein